MKTTLLLVLLLGLSLGVVAQDMQNENLLGKVESVITNKSFFAEVAGQWQEISKEIRRVKVFSPAGDYTLIGLYMNGKEYYRLEYTYNREGRLLEKRYYKNNGPTYTTREVLTYDDRGRLIEESTLEYRPPILGGDSLVEKTLVSYDERGYVTTRERLNSAGLLLSTLRYSRDDAGKLIKESSYDGKNALESINMYKYEAEKLSALHVLDSSNRIIEEINFGSERTLYDRTLYSYSQSKAVRSSRRVSDDYIEINEVVELADGQESSRSIQAAFSLEPITVDFEVEEPLEMIIDRGVGDRIEGIDFISGEKTLATVRYYFDNAGRILLREYKFADISLKVDYKYDSTGNWIEERLFRERPSGYKPISTISRDINYFKQ